MNKKTVLIPHAQNKTPCVVPRHAVWWSHLESLPTGLLHGQPEIDPVPRVVDHNHQHPSYRGERDSYCYYSVSLKIHNYSLFLFSSKKSAAESSPACRVHARGGQRLDKMAPKNKDDMSTKRGGDCVICIPWGRWPEPAPQPGQSWACHLYSWRRAQGSRL